MGIKLIKAEHRRDLKPIEATTKYFQFNVSKNSYVGHQIFFILRYICGKSP